MPHYKNSQNKVYWLDTDADRQFLPKDCEAISDEEASALIPKPEASYEEINAPVLVRLKLIDDQKIRAITDAILTGDKTKLQQLEVQAASERAKLTSRK